MAEHAAEEEEEVQHVDDERLVAERPSARMPRTAARGRPLDGGQDQHEAAHAQERVARARRVQKSTRPAQRER